MALNLKQKMEIIAKAQALTDEGKTLREIQAILGIASSTLGHWLKKVAAHDGNIDEAFAPRKKGRAEAVRFTDEEAALARFYRLTKESLDIAAHYFALDERVRPSLASALRRYEEKALERGSRIQWPMSVRRAFYVTAQEMSSFRGKKAAQQTESVTRRGMFEILADGSSREILSGHMWELDDYSANQPYFFPDPATGKQTLCRQVLAARDLSSASWLGFDHIGRERDAYRGEDVLRFIHRLIVSHGIPRALRLERGIWESSSVHGIEVEGLRGRWGDLGDIIHIEHVFKSKSKAIIEGGFNVLQRHLSHTGLDIGRHRGEFEEAARRLRQVRTGQDPADLGFLPIEKSSSLHESAARLINSRPMHRAHLSERVSADDLTARHGWNTTPLDDSLAWYFLPCKQTRIVRAGHVEVDPGGGWRPMTFAVNGVIDGLHLENGHRILIACDPLRPEVGARICNGDRSARNREGWGVGELLIEAAPLQSLAPQINHSRELSPHLPIRKKASAAARTSFRAITNAAKTPTSAAATDGQGQTARRCNLPETTETHATAPADLKPPRRAPAEAVTTSSRNPGADRAAMLAEVQRRRAENEILS